MQFLDNLTVMIVTTFGFYLLRHKVPEKYERRYFVAWLVSPLLAVVAYQEGTQGVVELVFILVQAALLLSLIAVWLIILGGRR
jgi:uncharacterized membrane protein YiaA